MSAIGRQPGPQQIVRLACLAVITACALRGLPPDEHLAVASVLALFWWSARWVWTAADV